MAVQIPRLQAIQTQDTMPKNDRINFKAQDQAGAIQSQTAAITGAVGLAGDVYQKFENEKIEQLSNVAEQDYSAWNKKALADLKDFDGDPTDAYNNYEKQSKTTRQGILDSRPDLNDRVKRHLTSRLNGVVKKGSIEADFQRGQQQEVYSNNVFESTAKLKKDSLAVNAGYIQKGDPSTYEMFDDNMRDIKTLIAKHGMKKGSVTQLPDDAETYSHKYIDDDGKEIKVSMSPMAKVRVAKELSEGVKNSLEVLIADGRIEEAKEMKERYNGYIDPVTAAKIEKKFKTAGRKDEAYSLIGSLRGQSSSAQMAAIDKIEDPELRSEALKIKDADDRRIENMKDRRSKANYESLANKTLEKMNSNQPFFGLADLENDKTFKATYDALDSKQKQAIIEMVETPKTTKADALSKFNGLKFGDSDVDVASMTYNEFANDYLTGMSKADRTKATAWFGKQKDPTAAEERSVMKRSDQVIKTMLLNSGQIKKNDVGAITGRHDKKLTAYREKMAEYLSTSKVQPNEEQLRRFTKELISQDITEAVFRPSGAPLKTQSQSNDRQPSEQNSTIPKELQGKNIPDLQARYMRDTGFGRVPNRKDPRFLNWVKTKG